MTKKHFESLARDIAASGEHHDVKLFAARIVILTAERDNLRFDRQRFLRACGLESA